VLREVKHFREHWRYKKLVQQVRLFPSQFTHLIYGLPAISLSELINPAVRPEEPILEDLCLPNHKQEPGHNDLEPLLKIIKHLQPKCVVELGTAHGNITANICRQSPHARVITVNALPEQISGDIITFTLLPELIGRVYRKYGYQGRVTQLYTNTKALDLSGHLPESSVDVAIIDACHDTPFVINDFYKVVPYIKPQGLVLLHDTHPSMEDHLAGSYRACMYLRRRGFDIRHLQNTWWALWQAPALTPERA
jgi:predicted O-methyltransferase YrrM